MTDFSRKLRNLNLRIENIQKSGLQPVTLKSPADIIERFVNRKGTSAEGKIKTYNQYVRDEIKSAERAKTEPKIVTKEEYQSLISSFVDDYSDQLTVLGNLRYQARAIMHKMDVAISKTAIDDDLYEKLSSLKKKDLIDLIKKAGEESNQGKKDGAYGSSEFYVLINRYLPDYQRGNKE